jgi:hypothetical protein
MIYSNKIKSSFLHISTRKLNKIHRSGSIEIQGLPAKLPSEICQKINKFVLNFYNLCKLCECGYYFLFLLIGKTDFCGNFGNSTVRLTMDGWYGQVGHDSPTIHAALVMEAIRERRRWTTRRLCLWNGAQLISQPLFIVVFLEIWSNMTPCEKGIYSYRVCKSKSTFDITACTIWKKWRGLYKFSSTFRRTT